MMKSGAEEVFAGASDRSAQSLAAAGNTSGERNRIGLRSWRSSAVLSHTDRLTAPVSLEGGDGEEVLVELRQAAPKASFTRPDGATLRHACFDGRDARDGHARSTLAAPSRESASPRRPAVQRKGPEWPVGW